MKNNSLFLAVLVLLVVGKMSFGQFVFYGSARQSGPGCYAVTPDSLNVVGAIWNTDQINLTNSFDLQYDLYFGTRDLLGADGFVFVLHADTNTFMGNVGTGSTIGYGNIAPSLGIEFDTYQNVWDPAYDHLAIEKNGDVNHSTANNLAGPVQIDASNVNVEDSAFHRVRITWNPATQTISVYFDCILRLTYTGDIINDIWSGNPNVYWGFTSATGSRRNYHEMCLVYASFANNLTDTTICAGKSVQLNFPSFSGNYVWSPASSLSNSTIANPIATPTVTTTYFVNLTDTCGVNVFDTVTISVNPRPTVSAGSGVSICTGKNTTLSASGGASYAWVPSTGLSSSSSPNPVASPASTTTYSVLAVDNNGCSNTSNVTVTVNPLPTANAGNNATICKGQSSQLEASGGIGYTWAPPSGLTSSVIANPLASPTTTTNYVVTVSNANGCTATDNVLITVNALPSVTVGPDVSICMGSDTIITATGSGTLSYLWSPSVGLSSPSITSPVANPAVSTIYVISATDNNGCTGRDSIFVEVENCNPSYIIVPNIFTPNADGKNEVFAIDYESISSYLIKIYNRWGILMYEGKMPSQSWDGKTTSGEKASDGTYYYVIQATGTDQKTYDLNGYLVLLR